MTKPKNCRLANCPEDNAATVETQSAQTIHQPQQRQIHWLMDTLKSMVLTMKAGVLKWVFHTHKKRSLAFVPSNKYTMENKNTKNLTHLQEKLNF
jgi:hypothetical protein